MKEKRNEEKYHKIKKLSFHWFANALDNRIDELTLDQIDYQWQITFVISIKRNESGNIA